MPSGDGLGIGRTEAEELHRQRPARPCDQESVAGLVPVSAGATIGGVCIPLRFGLNQPVGREFAESPQYWLNLQGSYDSKIAEVTLGNALRAPRRAQSGTDRP